jgi:3-hydroxybutyryl-CoA dehydratase
MQNPLFQTLYFEDLAVGMRATLCKTVENEDVIHFAELSGDHNPIHLSEHFARKTRFGGRIVHGLYTASLISGVIGMRLPGPGAVYISQTLNFRGPVKIGDLIDVSVEVVELTEKNRRVDMKRTSGIAAVDVAAGRLLDLSRPGSKTQSCRDSGHPHDPFLSCLVTAE